MNHAIALANLLLARAARLHDMGSGFRGRQAQWQTSDVFFGLAVAAGVAAVVWALWYVNLRQQGGGQRSRPLGLFFELCRAHGLRFTDRWLLWRLARAEGLRDPARLFLESERFESADLPAVLRLRAGQLERLRQRLFPEALDASPEGDLAANKETAVPESPPRGEQPPSLGLQSPSSWPSAQSGTDFSTADPGVPQTY